MTVSLHDHDLVLINSSAGKDSQAMLSHLFDLAQLQGYPRDQLLVVHADLGRVEWPGTRELARQQAACYGLRFEVVQRELGDLLTQIEGRGMFPSSAARYCTSDQKTSQVAKLMTQLVTEWRDGLSRPPMRILNCLGIRAEESTARAKKQPFGPDLAASNGRRTVTRWLPIFDWSEAQVWRKIRQSGLPHHEAYDRGMPRLSCVFCVLAGRKELTLAASLQPELAAEYAAVELRIGHRFKNDLAMEEIIRDAATMYPPLQAAEEVA